MAATVEDAAAKLEKSTGHEVFRKALDVTDSAAVATFAVTVEARLDRIDICVTNSIGPPSNVFKNAPLEAWRAALDQLSDEHHFFAKETLPRMQKNKWDA